MENNTNQFSNSAASAFINGERSRFSKPITDNEFLKKLPSGFHFRPTDLELITSYLVKKVNNQNLPLNLINDVNVYDFNPETLSAKYKLKDENDMYFFSKRQRKYKNGNRPSRAAPGGYWKATGADKPIKLKNGKEIGCKKSLVFFSGHPSEGKKTSWLMHEFRVKNLVPRRRTQEGDMTLGDWVLYKIFYNNRKQRSTSKNQQAEEMCNKTNEVLVTKQKRQPMAEPKSYSNNMGDPTNCDPNSFSYVNPNYFPNVESCPFPIHPDNAGTSWVGQVEVNNYDVPMMSANYAVPSFDVRIRRPDQETREMNGSGLLSSIVEEAACGYKRSRLSDN